MRSRPVPSRARRVLVVAFVLTVSVGATAAAGMVVNAIPDTPAVPIGWSFNGAAVAVPAGVQLTHAGTLNEAGSAFWKTPVDLGAPMSLAFDASMTGGGPVGADGIAVMFADASRGASPYAAGESASAIGFGGIPGIAVTLDTYQNTNEPSGNFIAIANGLDANGVPAEIARTADIPDLRSATRHVEVDVSLDHLDVSIDGTRVLSSNVALPSLAYVGFTAANGGYTDDHVVTNVLASADSGIGSIGSDGTPLPPAPTIPPTTPTTSSTAPSTGPAPATPNEDAPPAAAGYFTMLPPGSPLPTDAECAARRASLRVGAETGEQHRQPHDPDATSDARQLLAVERGVEHDVPDAHRRQLHRHHRRDRAVGRVQVGLVRQSRARPDGAGVQLAADRTKVTSNRARTGTACSTTPVTRAPLRSRSSR